MKSSSSIDFACASGLPFELISSSITNNLFFSISNMFSNACHSRRITLINSRKNKGDFSLSRSVFKSLPERMLLRLTGNDAITSDAPFLGQMKSLKHFLQLYANLFQYDFYVMIFLELFLRCLGLIVHFYVYCEVDQL